MPRVPSPAFRAVGGQLHCDGAAVEALAAEHGTPLFIYSAEAIRARFRAIAQAFRRLDPLIAYSVKANGTAGILRLLEAEGAGFDIVSGGELERVRRIGVSGERIIFAGVGKTAGEMRAALKAQVREFNLESAGEAERLQQIAASMKRIAPVALRINPDVDARTHAFISTGKKENKFGLALDEARTLAARIAQLPNLRLDGLHAHIGSQILDESPHAEAATIVDRFLSELREAGHQLRTLNFGGGFGISYKPGQKPLDLAKVAGVIEPLIKRHGLSLILEPGRSIVGPAGALITRVEYLKPGADRTFVIVDASMTELIRPALYSAHHEIVPVAARRGRKSRIDVVGPVCESADFLGKDREMALPAQGDLLAVLDAGAYGMVMASNYNTRPRPAEVLVDGGSHALIRRRETLRDILRCEL